jgi:3'-5' exoribonuclease
VKRRAPKATAPAAPGAPYREAPAAKYNHHAYRGGLLEHSVGVAQLVSALRRSSPASTATSPCAARCCTTSASSKRTTASRAAPTSRTRGKLEGEIPLGYYCVRREIESSPGFPRDLARALLHVILAHHGCLEYGSPVVPGTREAALVHAIDNLSGQLGAFDRLEKQTPAGERWSRYDRALGGPAFLG